MTNPHEAKLSSADPLTSNELFILFKSYFGYKTVILLFYFSLVSFADAARSCVQWKVWMEQLNKHTDKINY